VTEPHQQRAVGDCDEPQDTDLESNQRDDPPRLRAAERTPDIVDFTLLSPSEPGSTSKYECKPEIGAVSTYQPTSIANKRGIQCRAFLLEQFDAG